MKHPIRTSLVVIAAAGLIALGSTGQALADRLLTGDDIKNGSITSQDIENGSIRSWDLSGNTIRKADLSVGLQSQIFKNPAPGLTFHEVDGEVRAGVASGGTAEAVCPTGKVAIAGGYEFTSDPSGWTATASYPGHVDRSGVQPDVRNAWIVKLAGPTGQTADVTVYASCAYDFQ